MKKISYFLILLFAASVIFTGCRNDDYEPEIPEAIVVADPESLEQTVSADEKTGASTVEFTTQASWTSSIAKAPTTQSTRDASEMWASISPESGGRGTYEIEISLLPNTTGADRTVIITITSGGENIQIRITQRYVRADGTVAVTDVTLSDNELKLYVGETETLIATVLPTNATNRAVTWASSSDNIATVDNNGLVTAVSAGTATITVTTTDGAHTATAEVTILLPANQTDEGVVIDGIRWATRNVDYPGTFAQNPQDAGMFFQWNRRQGWAFTGYGGFTTPMPGWDSTLPEGTAWYAENDPCPTGWRVPTQAELQSLINAGSTWTTLSGVNGRLYGTAPNQIFLPAAGERWGHNGTRHDVGWGGSYWSSTPDSIRASSAWRLWLHNSFGGFSGMINGTRSSGFSVRCVQE